MKEQQLLERVTLNPKVMAGKPVIRGTRLTVEYILGLLAQGTTPTEILDEHKGLTQEDLQACFLFAAKSLRVPQPHHPLRGLPVEYKDSFDPVAEQDWSVLS